MPLGEVVLGVHCDASLGTHQIKLTGEEGKYFMISVVVRSGLQMSSRAMHAIRTLVLLGGLVGLLAACGGGSGSTVTPPAAQLTSITVGPTAASVVAGRTLQFTATAHYSDNTQKDVTASVTWTSAATGVATISASGMATGISTGTSSVSAMLSSVIGTDVLTVTPATLVSIVITPNKPNVAIGKTVQFKAVGTYTDGSTQVVTSGVAWTTSNSATATITSDSNPGGVATAVALGTTQIGAAAAGGVTATSVQMTVTATVYAYATNFDADTVSQYVLGSNGSLTPLSVPAVAAGHQPFSISVEPTGEYVYVSNFTSSSISQYRIGADGTLSPIGSGTVDSGIQPNAVTIDHADRFAYVANLGESTLSQYKIGLDGALIPLSSPKVASGPNPAAITVDPTNHFAYAANFASAQLAPPPGPSTISQYSIGADGSLSPMSAPTIACGSGPNSLMVDPSGKYLYVANLGDGNVGQYTINTDGSLAPMTPPTVMSSAGAGAKPFSLAIDPTGSFVYVANQAADKISQYRIGTNGGLVPLTIPDVAAGAGVSGLTIEPTGKSLYATNRGAATVSQFSIGTDGSLTPMTPSTVPSGLHPTAIATGY